MDKGIKINFAEVKFKNQVFNNICKKGYYESADYLKEVANLSIGVADYFLAKGFNAYEFGTDETRGNVLSFLNLCDVRALNNREENINSDEIKKIENGAGIARDCINEASKKFYGDAENQAVKDLITRLNNIIGTSKNANSNEQISIKDFEKVLERKIEEAEKAVKEAEKKVNKNQDNKNDKKPSKLFIKIAGGVVTIGVVVGGVLTIKHCNEKDKDTQFPMEWNTGDENSSDKIPYVNPAEERENSTQPPKEEDRRFNDSPKEDSTAGTSDRNLSGLINTKPQEKETETTATSTEKSDNTNDPFEDIFGDAEPEM